MNLPKLLLPPLPPMEVLSLLGPDGCLARTFDPAMGLMRWEDTRCARLRADERADGVDVMVVIMLNLPDGERASKAEGRRR